MKIVVPDRRIVLPGLMPLHKAVEQARAFLAQDGAAGVIAIVADSEKIISLGVPVSKWQMDFGIDLPKGYRYSFADEAQKRTAYWARGVRKFPVYSLVQGRFTGMDSADTTKIMDIAQVRRPPMIVAGART